MIIVPKVMLVELTSDFRWIGSIVTRHISRNKEFFCETRRETSSVIALLGKPIKNLNTDRRGEFEFFNNLCKLNGIKHIYIML